MGNNAIFLGETALVAPEVIEHGDFDSVSELKELVKRQALPFGVLTKKAWSKYEGMLFTKEDLTNDTK